LIELQEPHIIDYFDQFADSLAYYYFDFELVVGLDNSGIVEDFDNTELVEDFDYFEVDILESFGQDLKVEICHLDFLESLDCFDIALF
jgi:hypothetical protein